MTLQEAEKRIKILTKIICGIKDRNGGSCEYCRYADKDGFLLNRKTRHITCDPCKFKVKENLIK